MDASVGFIHKESVTKHGHTIIKYKAWNFYGWPHSLAVSCCSGKRYWHFRKTFCLLLQVQCEITCHLWPYCCLCQQVHLTEYTWSASL